MNPEDYTHDDDKDIILQLDRNVDWRKQNWYRKLCPQSQDES